MRYCPKCHGEFQNWATVCHVCHVPLLDTLPSVQPPVASSKPVHTHIRDEIVTIASFSHPQEAHIFSAKLESAGIPSFVADENVITMNWFYSNAVGGVKLQVFKSDATEARRILGLAESNTPPAKYAGEVCPKCGSSDTRYETSYRLPTIILTLITLGSLGILTLPFRRWNWKCSSCGYRWKNQD